MDFDPSQALINWRAAQEFTTVQKRSGELDFNLVLRAARNRDPVSRASWDRLESLSRIGSDRLGPQVFRGGFPKKLVRRGQSDSRNELVHVALLDGRQSRTF